MAERFAETPHGISLCYETFGEAQGEPLVLVMGLGTQMIAWHEELCGALAGAGFHVVRFDNRDTGRSSRASFRPPTLAQLLRRRLPPEQYSLADMADDTAALIDALGLGPAHVVGASMGGMIAQVLAARRPGHVRSLVSIMSNTGSRLSGQPALSLYRHFLRQAPHEREAFAEHVVGLFARIGSVELGADPDEVRELARRSYDRGHDPAATARQLGAIAKTGNRTAMLRRIAVPTLVVHGTRDRLVKPSGGRATARAVPGAELELVAGMGHDLPRAVWPRLVAGIARTAARAQRAG